MVPIIKEDNQLIYLNNNQGIINNETMTDLEDQIKNFVAQFVFPYIRGWVTKDEFDSRTPLMVALKEKIGISDDPELEDKVGDIALDAYFDEAAKGLYVRCNILSFDPFDVENLPKHLLIGGSYYCGNLPVEDGGAELVKQLEKSIPTDFPGLILSEDQMEEKANQSMTKCNDQRLSDYELENTRRIERDEERKGLQKRKRAKLKELEAERKNKNLRSAIENREWETIEKLFYNKLITHDSYCWAIGELAKGEENVNKLEHLLNSLKPSFVKEIILHAEEENNAKVIECLLPYINSQTLRNLFRLAVDRSKKEIIKLLVNEVKPIDFIRTLQSACKKEALEIVNMLTDNTVVSDHLLGRAFCKSAANNDEECVNILHQKSLVSIKDKEQAICLAAAYGCKTMVEHLLTLEPRINSRDEVLCEAICLARTYDYEEIAELLCRSYLPSEEIMIQNPEKEGFLIAAKNGHEEIVTELLHLIDYKGISEAIRLAEANDRGEVTDILLEHAKVMIVAAYSESNIEVIEGLLIHF